MAEQRLLLLIHGFGTISGYDALASGDLTAGLISDAGIATVLPVLDIDDVDVMSQKMAPLSTVGSEVGFDITVPYLSGSSAVALATQRLARSQISPFTHSGGSAVRVTEGMDSGEVVWNITDADDNFASGLPKYAWVGGEVVSVTTRNSATQIVTTRARLGTQSLAHPLQHPGLVLMSAPASVTGMRCTLYRGPATATTLSQMSTIFVGIVGPISMSSASSLSIEINSRFERLKKTSFDPPRAISIEGEYSALCYPAQREQGRIGISHWFVNTDLYSTTQWNYATATIVEGEAEGAWFTWVPGNPTSDSLSFAAEYVTVDQYPYESSIAPIAYGFEDRRVTADQWRAKFGDDTPHGVRCRIEYAVAWTSNQTLGTMVTDLLGTTFSPRVSLSLTTSEYEAASFDRLNDAYFLASGASFVIPPPDAGTTVLDVIEGLIGPAFCGIAIGSDGKLRGINWTEAESTTALTLTSANVIDYAMSRAHDVVLKSVTLDPGDERDVELIISDYAAQSVTSGSEPAFDVGPIGWGAGMEVLRQRAIQILATYSFAPYVLARELNSSVSVEVGDTVSVTDSGVIDADGSLGITSELGLVYQVGRALADDSRTVQILMTGMQRTKGLATWTACGESSVGEIAGATTINLSANVFTVATGPIATDAAAFADYVGAKVRLFDEFGTVKSDDATGADVLIVSVGSNAITVDNAFQSAAPANIAITAGDIIMLAPYDEQTAAIKALNGGYQADANGVLGAANDDARGWY